MPFGGSLVSLIEAYRIAWGKVLLLSEVSQSLKSGWGGAAARPPASAASPPPPCSALTAGCSWSTIWASSGMKLGDKWQF